MAFNSARPDAFYLWSQGLLDSRRGTTSASYLPSDLNVYASSFDQDGSWELPGAVRLRVVSDRRGNLAALLLRQVAVLRRRRLELHRSRTPLAVPDAPLRPLGTEQRALVLGRPRGAGRRPGCTGRSRRDTLAGARSDGTIAPCSGSGAIAATTTATTQDARGRSSMPARSAAAMPQRATFRSAGVPWCVGAELRRPTEPAAHRDSARQCSDAEQPFCRKSRSAAWIWRDDCRPARLDDARLSRRGVGRRELVSAVARIQRHHSIRVEDVPSGRRAAPSGENACRGGAARILDQDLLEPRSRHYARASACGRRAHQRRPSSTTAARPCPLERSSNPADAYGRAGVAVPRNLPGSAGSSRSIMPDGGPRGVAPPQYRGPSGASQGDGDSSPRSGGRMSAPGAAPRYGVPSAAPRSNPSYSGPGISSPAPSPRMSSPMRSMARRPACPGPQCDPLRRAIGAAERGARAGGATQRRSLPTLRRPDADVGASRSHRPPCRHRGAVRGRGDGRQRQRPALRRRPATCRRSRRSTTTRRAPSRASTPPTAQVVGEFATQRRVVIYLRSDLAAAASGDHRRRRPDASIRTSA